MVDAADSKSAGSNTVRVRVSPWAPIFRKTYHTASAPAFVGTGGGARGVGYEYLGKMKPEITPGAAASPEQPADRNARFAAALGPFVNTYGDFAG